MSDDSEVNEPLAFVLPQWVRHGNNVICTVDVHPSGEYFATGGWDAYTKIWSFPAILPGNKVKNKLIAILQGHTGPVNCVRFSPDGKFLATCGDDSMVYIWQRVRCFGKPSTFGVPDNALTPNRPVQKWTSRSFPSHSGDATGIAWSPDSTKLASCSIDGQVFLWDVKTTSLLWKAQCGMGVLSVAYDPLEHFIVFQTISKQLQVYSTQGKLVRKVEDGFSTMEETITSRICWTPDGSFIGASSGYANQYISPFYERDNFNFAFALEGHGAASSCVSTPHFLYRKDGTLCSMIAAVDSIGTLSVWLVGNETRPLFILNRIATSACNDIAWSPDGKVILVALESDPITRKGAVMGCIINTTFNAEQLDPAEMEEIHENLLGETSFKRRTARSREVQDIVDSLEVTENEADLEILQLSVDEVRERQVESIVDGVRTIQPVLLTAVEKQHVAYHCTFNGLPTKHIPVELNRDWPCSASFPGKIDIIVEVNDTLIIASDLYLMKVSKATGRRLTPPVFCESKIRTLEVHDQTCIAVGSAYKCFFISIANMKVEFTAECSPAFTTFGVINNELLIGSCHGASYIYDRTAGRWIGGAISQKLDDTTIPQIEQMAKMTESEAAAVQWSTFGVSMVFEKFIGQTDDVEHQLKRRGDLATNDSSQQYIADLAQAIKRND